ncbi:hypothetical protein DAEQUDRAFT_765079 [Daedalea quercina L-15889]|uniref:Uncharacterized protein n=1 Tax=Daedalea quercina L-15889 TaxID=1314783 RepID=A0A165QXL6_9APHY|nr:hypothetical protein DAEQUDRAFT_765079 [Daedalea quercina L-15889]
MPAIARRWRLPLTLSLPLITILACATPISREVAVSSGACSTTSNVVTVYNLLIYLVGNYAIHAAAIPLGAEVGGDAEQVTRQWAWPWTAWLTTLSLFLPFSALTRSIVLIVQQYKYRDNSVLAALQHGALLVVVRNTDWEPHSSDEVVYTWLPVNSGIDSDDIVDEADHGTELSIRKLPPAVIRFDEKEEAAYRRVDYRNHLLHGIARPPAGYTLAVPGRKSHTELLIKEQLQDTRELKVHFRKSAIGTLLSLAHLVVGSYELYVSWLDEIPRWGYAAYGLSVIPYLLMSVANLLCALYVGSYPCAQLLRTPILDESIRRSIALSGVPGNVAPAYDGTIGTPLVEDIPNPRGHGRYVAVKMRVETIVEDGRSYKRLVVTKDGTQREWAYRLQTNTDEPEEEDAGVKHEAIADGSRSEYARDVGEHEDPPAREDCGAQRIGSACFTVSALNHNGPPPDSRLREVETWANAELTATSILYIVTLLLPYMIIYGLTGFRPAQSTKAQRAWMMTWLVADQYSFVFTLVFAFAGWTFTRATSFKSALSARTSAGDSRRPEADGAIRSTAELIRLTGTIVTDSEELKASRFLLYALLMVPGVGGFVTVIRMYLQDHGYGLRQCSS